MMKNLPGEQVELLEKAFKKARKKRELLRFQALLLLTQDYRRMEVSKMVRVSTHAIEDWVIQFKKQGIEGLQNLKVSSGHQSLYQG